MINQKLRIYLFQIINSNQNHLEKLILKEILLFNKKDLDKIYPLIDQ